ncbi:MAG: ABC transporter permease [Chitinophagaceae bacterium]|nr:ABC transporter permease [Chitinophagaceae bacterium]
MFSNAFKIAVRNLLKSKSFSLINILGLSTGMAVVILIGLWMYDELTYDQYHSNYRSLGQVMTVQHRDGKTNVHSMVAAPLAAALRTGYPDDFKAVSRTSNRTTWLLASGDKKFNKTGIWVEDQFPSMFGLTMKQGDYSVLKDPSSVIVSESLANAFFGHEDPIGKTIRINNQQDVKVAGIYEDLPSNTTLSGTEFFGTWGMYENLDRSARGGNDSWGMHSFSCYVQLKDPNNLDQVNKKVEKVPMEHLNASESGVEGIMVHPMKDWYLRSEFKDGKAAGGRIQFVWLFGIIGGFVLLLACINFMNLSTARSEKRAREVGIRKAIGSLRLQLIRQFLLESVLVATVSAIIAILLVYFSIGWFNQLAAKQIHILWKEPLFWTCNLGFTVITGLLAGSYPAFYLSSFQPVKVLKGTFKTGRLASIPRKALVVVQFTVSIVLIIGTIVVLRQIQFARNRPAGFDKEGLIQVFINTPGLRGHYDLLRGDLLKTGVVADMGQSSSPVSSLWAQQVGFKWQGMDPSSLPVLGTTAVTHDFGNTVQWNITQGRDFNRDFASDSNAIILNEAALDLMGFKDPIGQIIDWDGDRLHVIGVVKNIIMNSPYQPVKPGIFLLSYTWSEVINIRIKPGTPLPAALASMEQVFKKHDPASPFEYKFADEMYGAKFKAEERIGKLGAFFAALAIFISCLGIFGLASYMAEQRVKEIGVRKVLGASVFNIWRLLSKDFLLLVIIAFLVSAPTAWFFMNNWLQDYHYRTELSWWLFAVSLGGALVITLSTVSYQAIRAALSNPVKSLRSE